MSAAGKRILVVDDDKKVLRMLKKFLGNLNHTVYTAENAMEAVKLLAEAKPHLIITDLKMPGIDGISLTAAIKKHEKGNKIPIIVLTAHGSPESMRSSYDAGADLFISKPIKVYDLLVLVDRLLDQSKIA
ncbi:response regulator [bacterium]|nr:response regulator [candidate division CSSED10-310 bacterium]